jgi:hypothetical protein
LLPFSTELCIFSSPFKELKNYNIQDYNFVCGSAWVFWSWLLTLREKNGMRVFDKRVLGKISVPKRVEVRSWAICSLPHV